MYALILIIWAQEFSSLTPYIRRLEVDPVIYTTLDSCRKSGNLKLGALPPDNVEAPHFLWQDYACRKFD